MQSRFVVDGDFLAGPDITEGNEHNVAVENLHEGIRLARVIYVMRAVAAAATVEAPAIIDGTDAQFAARSPTVRLGICDFLASVLGDLSSVLEGNNSKASLTFNRGFFYCQTWRQLELHFNLGIVTQTDRV